MRITRHTTNGSHRAATRWICEKAQDSCCEKLQRQTTALNIIYPPSKNNHEVTNLESNYLRTLRKPPYKSRKWHPSLWPVKLAMVLAFALLTSSVMQIPINWACSQDSLGMTWVVGLGVSLIGIATSIGGTLWILDR